MSAVRRLLFWAVSADADQSRLIANLLHVCCKPSAANLYWLELILIDGEVWEDVSACMDFYCAGQADSDAHAFDARASDAYTFGIPGSDDHDRLQRLIQAWGFRLPADKS